MGLFGDLLVRLRADTGQFSTSFTNATSSVDTFSKNIAGSFKKIDNSAKQTSREMNLFAKETHGTFKSVGRIAQGIIVSQAFYRMTNAIQGAVAALGEFSSQSEQAQVSFGLLMKDTDKAERFMNYLEDFAAKTPYTFQEAAVNVRKLLAYGFDPSSIGVVESALADASAASGDAQTFHSVGKALGQIRTKGRLAAQEMLQITEAGIPAFEILREKLGLTGDQLAEIGNLRIPADVAINAILAGMQERYGGAAAAMSETTGGMLNTIKDNALIIGKDAFSGLYEGFALQLRKIRDASDRLRGIVRASGWGGLVRELIPADIFPKIQLLVANMRLLVQTGQILSKALSPVFRAIGSVFLNVITTILPLINAFLRLLAVMVGYLTQNETALRRFIGAFLGIAIAGWAANILLNFTAVLKGMVIIKVIAQLVIILARAFRILAIAMFSNPWVALIALAAGSLLYLGLVSGKVSGALTNLGNKITKAFGADPSKEFLPSMEDNTATTDEFNQSLGVSTESLDKLGDSAKTAGKKAKEALMAFDEVFSLNEQDSTTGTDGLNLDDISAITIPDIEIPEFELPGVKETITTWVENFKTTFGTTIKNVLTGAAIGGIIGGVFGGLIGGPGGVIIGAKIGILAGAIAGLFWEELPKKFKDSADGVTIGMVIGAVLGGIIGGPGGVAIGMGVGALVGGLIDYFMPEIEAQFTSDTGIGASIGAGLGMIIGGIIAGPAGVVIGGAIGSLVGGMLGMFSDEIVASWTSDAQVGVTWGTQIGAIIGGLVAGPPGIIIGAAIGALTGWIVGYFWDDLIKKFKEGKSPQMALGATIGAVVGGVIFGPIGAAIGGVVGGILASNDEAVEEWKKTMVEKIQGWYDETTEKLSTWWADNSKGFSKWFTEVQNGFNTWGVETCSSIEKWYTDSTNKIDNWLSDKKTKFTTWWSEQKTGFSNWKTETAASILTWTVTTGFSLATWATERKKAFDTWWSESKTGFSNWRTETGNSIIGWATDNKGRFVGWLAERKTNFDTWWKDSKAGFKTWSKDVYDGVWEWFDKLGSKLKTFFDNLAFWKKDAEENANVTITTKTTSAGTLTGHAAGGIFNKEHIARFAEGGKAEAIIPLENAQAMQPFVDAVAAGVSSVMGSVIAELSSASAAITPTGSSAPNMYVGTLIADDRSLRELNRRMASVQIQETSRRG